MPQPSAEDHSATTVTASTTESPLGDFAPPSTPAPVAAPAAAPAPEPQPQPIHEAVRQILVNSHDFQIGYRVDDVGPSGVGKVELFITQDGGRVVPLRHRPGPEESLRRDRARRRRLRFRVACEERSGNRRRSAPSRRQAFDRRDRRQDAAGGGAAATASRARQVAEQDPPALDGDRPAPGCGSDPAGIRRASRAARSRKSPTGSRTPATSSGRSSREFPARFTCG